MSLQHQKSQRGSNFSTSPLPQMKSSDKKNSIKISLLKLNDSFVKPPDSSAKLSKSLNSQLPQISKVKKPQAFLDKPQKLNRKSILESNQSPSYSMYFSPSRDHNASATFKDAKSLFDEENKKKIDKARYDEIQKKREFLRTKREYIYKFEPNLKPKIYQGALHITLLLKSYNEDFILKSFENTDDAKFQALERICDIETCFYKIYEDFTGELVELKENLFDSEQYKLLLSQKLEKIQSEYEEKLRKNTRKETPKDKEIGYLLFENSKLEMEIQKINERLKVFENYDAGPLMKELELLKLHSEEKIKSLQYELNILQGKDDGHQNLINFYKNNINKLEKDVKHWILTSGENQKIIDRLTEKQEIMKNSLNKFREVSMMQNEEISSLMAKKHDNSVIQHDLLEKIKQLNLKIDKITIQKGDNVNESDYKGDLAIISTLSDFFNENLFQKITKNNPISNHLLSGVSHKAPNIAPVRSYESSATHPTALRKYNFLKAPFFKLIEHRFKTMNYSLKVSKKPNFHELLAKIRGVFDSKYNEFLYFSEPKLLTTFPDFVYSWLGKYEVDYTFHQVKKMDPFNYNNNLDDTRIQFLVELTNPKIEKLWECSTFCEFLEEKFSLDELYFYLHCRNLLLKGPQLQYLSAFFDLIHFVSFERAEMMVDLIMHKYDISIKSTIKSKLSEKAKRKGPHTFIDSAFVLRVLLEYYRLERVDKFNLLDELFNSKMHKDDDKDTVSFENFKKILQFNWPQLTDLETAELFRETWGIGQGSVNAESFFAVANENKFFIKTIKMPSVMTFEEVLQSKNPYEKIRADFFDIYGIIKDKIEGIENIISSFGLEMIDEKFRKMIKIVQSEFQMPSEEMREKFISHFALEFNHLLNLILKIAKCGNILEDPLNELKLLGNKENFKEIALVVKEIGKEETLREIRENVIARKIQKKLKMKIKKPQGQSAAQVVKSVKK